MGVCSSKPKGSPKQAASPEPAAAQPAAAAAADGPSPAEVQQQAQPQQPQPAAAAAADDEPQTPQPGTAADGDTDHLGQTHKYNSTEKPSKSALRGMDAKSDGFSRRSTSGVSGVGFCVRTDAPDAEEHHRTFAGADSISLKKILDIFYDKVLEDPKLGPYFEGIDMIKLKRHQLRFMSLAFGGKELVFEEDPNLNLRKIHYHLIRDRGLSLAHWELFVGRFEETMQQLEKEVPLETREAACRSIRATRHYFVPIGEETAYTNANIGALPEAETAAGTAARGAAA